MIIRGISMRKWQMSSPPRPARTHRARARGGVRGIWSCWVLQGAVPQRSPFTRNAWGAHMPPNAWLDICQGKPSAPLIPAGISLSSWDSWIQLTEKVVLSILAKHCVWILQINNNSHHVFSAPLRPFGTGRRNQQEFSLRSRRFHCHRQGLCYCE